jgi:hypothetical protein
MLLRENRGHQDIDGMPDHLSFRVAEHLGEPLTGFQYFAHRLFIAAEMNDGSVIAKQDFVRFAYLIEAFLCTCPVEGLL